MSGERLKPIGDSSERKEQTAQMVSSGFEGLVKSLEQGKSETFLNYLSFCAKFHQYSQYNQMLIWIQMPNASRVAGYQKWKELGYAVRKGEKGIAILAPLIIKGKDENDLESKSLVGFKVVYVFNESQLANVAEKPLPSPFKELPDDREELFERVRQTIEDSGIVVEFLPLQAGIFGLSIGGKIVVAQGWDSQNRTGILLHEWAHELLHRAWMSDKERQELPVAIRECQAEAVAYIVSQFFGLDNTFSADYLQHYDVTPQLLIDNFDQVQRASHYMIERLQP